MDLESAIVIAVTHICHTSSDTTVTHNSNRVGVVIVVCQCFNLATQGMYKGLCKVYCDIPSLDRLDGIRRCT